MVVQLPRGGDEEAYTLGEYGQYVTFVEGQCQNSPYCDYFHGDNSRPALGPYVGWQDNSDDPRNPTDRAYWYSLPGECPQSKWADKTEGCINDQPSGLCEEGVMPNGETCTWSYTMLGQINLDDLVGITNTLNPATGANFVDAEEYCLAGNVEFERDPSDYSFVSGLAFWENPLSRQANAARVDTLLSFYEQGANNIALPAGAVVRAGNPLCYMSSPGCFENGAVTCARDEEQFFAACAGADCPPAVEDAEVAFDASALNQVKLPSGDNSSFSSSSSATEIKLPSEDDSATEFKLPSGDDATSSPSSAAKVATASNCVLAGAMALVGGIH